MSSRVQIDTEAVSLLSKLLVDSGLTEIEYKQGDTLIRVAKHSTAVHSTAVHTTHVAPTHPAPLAPLGADTRASDPVVEGFLIKSPIVGTAYRSANPEADPFVQVGSVVKEGDILLILEAMKVMNPIRASKGGKVIEICVENGSPVEYDQVLIRLDV